MFRHRQEILRRPGLSRRRRARMNDRNRSPRRPGSQTRGPSLAARHFAPFRAQIKHGAGQMFRRVHLALHAQNLLRARDAHVVRRRWRKCAKPARYRAPESAVIQALRVAAVQVQANHGRQRRTAPASGGRISSRSGLPSKTRRNRSSTTTAMRRSGRARLRISSAGVVSTQSPSDRSRRTATRLARGKHSRTLCTARLFFDLRLVHQHHRNIVADRIDAMALHALQAALVRLQIQQWPCRRGRPEFPAVLC